MLTLEPSIAVRAEVKGKDANVWVRISQKHGQKKSLMTYVSGMNWVVTALFCLVPMAAWLLTLLAMRGYELDGQRVKTIQAVANGMFIEEAMRTITDETVK